MHTKAGPILSIHSEDFEWKRNSDLLIKGHNSKFYHLVLTILVVTETSNYINTERQCEFSIAPLFQSPTFKKRGYNNNKVHYSSSLQVFSLLSVPPRESTVIFFILCKPYICAKYYVQDSKALSKKHNYENSYDSYDSYDVNI